MIAPYEDDELKTVQETFSSSAKNERIKAMNDEISLNWQLDVLLVVR
jgi:hypothetical protein